MKRFSKIVSVITEVPEAWVKQRHHLGLKSVGKPGYGKVRSSTGRNGSVRVTRSEVGADVVVCGDNGARFRAVW